MFETSSNAEISQSWTKPKYLKVEQMNWCAVCIRSPFPDWKKKKKKERKGKTRLMATQKLKKWKLGKYSHCLYLDGSKTREVDHKYAHIWPPVFLPDEVLALLKTTWRPFSLEERFLLRHRELWRRRSNLTSWSQETDCTSDRLWIDTGDDSAKAFESR